MRDGRDSNVGNSVSIPKAQAVEAINPPKEMVPFFFHNSTHVGYHEWDRV